MDYEKKYKEALNWMKDVYPTLEGAAKEDAEHYFPELAESEDEKIRKEIINYFECQSRDEPTRKDTHNKWIAWLEKQGNANKEYWRGYREGKQEILDKYAELEKQGKQKPIDKIQPKFKVGQTIKKEGFNLGFNIVKIDDDFYYNNMGDYFPFTDQDNWELVEQKLAEVRTGYCNVQYAEQKPTDNEMKEILHTEYEKERADAITEMQKEWSEEDEKCINELIKFFDSLTKCLATEERHQENRRWLKFLKSLKERVQPQPKQEWSKEDKRIRIETIELLETANHPNKMHSNGKPLDFTENINWLKSLRPQNWKPSEEQIKALKEAVDEHFDIDGDALWHLYQELKNLKDEK